MANEKTNGLKANPVKWVWMDLDDTLIDFNRNSRTALRRLYSDEGLQAWYPSPEEWTEAYEKSNKPLWKRYAAGEIKVGQLRLERFFIPLAEGGMDKEEALTRARRYDTLYLDLLAQEKATVPYAHEILRALRAKGYKIGILSNGFREVQYRKIASAGLSDLVDLVVLSDDIGITKPHPEIYRYAMARSGCTDTADHLMVGDNIDTDIQGALNAGWQAIHYDPYNTQSDFPSISSLADLESIL